MVELIKYDFILFHHYLLQQFPTEASRKRAFLSLWGISCFLVLFVFALIFYTMPTLEAKFTLDPVIILFLIFGSSSLQYAKFFPADMKKTQFLLLNHFRNIEIFNYYYFKALLWKCGFIGIYILIPFLFYFFVRRQLEWYYLLYAIPICIVIFFGYLMKLICLYVSLMFRIKNKQVKAIYRGLLIGLCCVFGLLLFIYPAWIIIMPYIFPSRLAHILWVQLSQGQYATFLLTTVCIIVGSVPAFKLLAKAINALPVFMESSNGKKVDATGQDSFPKRLLRTASLSFRFSHVLRKDLMILGRYFKHNIRMLITTGILVVIFSWGSVHYFYNRDNNPGLEWIETIGIILIIIIDYRFSPYCGIDLEGSPIIPFLMSGMHYKYYVHSRLLCTFILYGVYVTIGFFILILTSQVTFQQWLLGYLICCFFLQCLLAARIGSSCAFTNFSRKDISELPSKRSQLFFSLVLACILFFHFSSILLIHHVIYQSLIEMVVYAFISWNLISFAHNNLGIRSDAVNPPLNKFF